MTYPPGSSGFPPAQPPPGAYGSAPPSFSRSEQAPANLALYLNIAVALLGLAAYLTSFGPMYDIDSPIGNFSVGGSWTSTAAMLAALLAAVSVLPKAKNHTAVVAVIAVLGALLAVSNLFDKPGQASVGWGLWSVLFFTVVQAIVAVTALLLDSGLVSAPAPKPKYAPYGYPPGGYYGQPGGYPSYGGYPSGGGFGAPAGPSPGGFASGSPSGQHHQGPPTPPTGFPSFSPPPPSGQSPGSGNTGTGNSGHGPTASSSEPSGPAQS